MKIQVKTEVTFEKEIYLTIPVYRKIFDGVVYKHCMINDEPKTVCIHLPSSILVNPLNVDSYECKGDWREATEDEYFVCLNKFLYVINQK